MNCLPRYVKISRNGERFWIANPKETKNGTYIGFVANHLLNNSYKYGSIISFKLSEVVETIQ